MKSSWSLRVQILWDIYKKVKVQQQWQQLEVLGIVKTTCEPLQQMKVVFRAVKIWEIARRNAMLLNKSNFQKWLQRGINP